MWSIESPLERIIIIVVASRSRLDDVMEDVLKDVMGLYAVDRATTSALGHRDRLMQLPKCSKISRQKFGEVMETENIAKHQYRANLKRSGYAKPLASGGVIPSRSLSNTSDMVHSIHETSLRLW